MSTVLEEMASWVCGLSSTAIPEDVLQRARLLQLSAAGALRWGKASALARSQRQAASARGGVQLLGSNRRASHSDAAAYHAAAIEHSHYGSRLMGCPTVGAVTGAWTTRGERLEDLLAGCVAGLEVMGRYRALAGISGASRAKAVALASAAAAARTTGSDASVTARALSLALTTAPTGEGPISLSEACRAGVQALASAKRGLTGDPSAWPSGSESALETPSGLGQLWFSRALAYKLSPAPDSAQVPIQALQTIFQRHRKAASKPLRVNQVESLTVWLDQASYRIQSRAGDRPGGLRWWLARTCVRQEERLPTPLEEGELSDLAELLPKISLRPSLGCTLQGLEPRLMGGLPLLRQQSPGAWLRQGLSALSQLEDEEPLPWQTLTALPWGRLLSRPVQTGLLALEPAAWRETFPVELSLTSTRGGRWPEQRSLPEGYPGQSWAEVRGGILRKYGAEDARAQELLESPLRTPAGEWLLALAE